MVKLLLLFGPLLSTLGLIVGGSARLRGDGDGAHAGESGVTNLIGDNPTEHDAHFATAEDDPDRGYVAFGRLVEKITILGVLVVALLVVGLILSLAGVFESDVWDPPV